MTMGRLITLEGGEGAGKSSAVELVCNWLRTQGRTVVATREPGGTAVAERVRAILLDPETGDLAPMSELLLMFAARSENLAKVIRPALEAGHDVVCDRFTDASLAYQGGGRELGAAPIRALANIVHPDLTPSLTLLLDVPVNIGMQRVALRGEASNRFEQTRQDFLERVRMAYLEEARSNPGRFTIIDATAPMEAVHQAIQQALAERLNAALD